jgi:chaperonin GroEL (HSP60 family)
LIAREILHHNDVERVWAEKNENVGFNAVTEEFEDLVKAGVIDPTKVTRTALMLKSDYPAQALRLIWLR